jgi:hypothetical protein
MRNRPGGTVVLTQVLQEIAIWQWWRGGGGGEDRVGSRFRSLNEAGTNWRIENFSCLFLS